MKPAVFIFGRTPDLSLAELTSLFPTATEFIPGAGIVPDADVEAGVLHRLGGTVKLVELIRETDTLTEDAFVSALMEVAREPRVTFGISSYGGVGVPASVMAAIKTDLAARGISSRYVETKQAHTLSSVVVSKQHVIELNVIKKDDRYHLGVTRAVQDFEDWNRRDYGRPATDPKAGMLPPKVARMIANIALGAASGYTPTLLDPFCGVGTVIAEGLLCGANAIGSDISDEAVTKAKANIDWLRKTYPTVGTQYCKLFVCDATHVSKEIPAGSVDAIATEPFMGENVDTKDVGKLNPSKVKNTLKGLEKLYIGALREWAPIIKSGGKIVMAMPAYVMERDVMRVKNVVDRCESLGYTLITEPIEYSRPQAVVRREFYIFKKN